jgi:mannosyltransferase OCH1-like enzyme
MEGSNLHLLRTKLLDLRAQGEHIATIEGFKELLNQYPDDQRSYIDIAISFREVGNLEESIYYINALLKREDTQDNWRQVAEKNLVQALFSYVNQLISKGHFNKASLFWQNHLKEQTILEADIPKVSLINFRFSCEAGLGTMASFEHYYFLEKLKDRNKYEALAREVAFYCFKTGEYTLADTISSWYQLHPWSDLLKLNVSLETKTFIQTLQLSDQILAKPKLPLHVEHNVYQKRFSLGLLLAEPQITDDALGQLLKLSNTDNQWGQAMLNIRRQYLNVYKTVDVVQLAKQTDKQNLSSTYIQQIKNEENFFKQVVVSSLYLSKLILPNGHNAKISGEPTHVPKKIMQYWDQQTPPDDVLVNIESWKKAYSDYEYKLFNFESASNYLLTHFGQEQVDLFQKRNHPAMQADIFRLFFLYNEGGVYADVDIYCQRKVSADNSATLRYQIFNILEITNDFIALPKQSPIIKLALETLATFEEDLLQDKNVWWVTGPGLFNYCLAQAYSHSLVNQTEFDHEITLIHNCNYRQSIKSSELEYKKSTRAWQLQVTSE